MPTTFYFISIFIFYISNSIFFLTLFFFKKNFLNYLESLKILTGQAWFKKKNLFRHDHILLVYVPVTWQTL